MKNQSACFSLRRYVSYIRQHLSSMRQRFSSISRSFSWNNETKRRAAKAGAAFAVLILIGAVVFSTAGGDGAADEPLPRAAELSASPGAEDPENAEGAENPVDADDAVWVPRDVYGIQVNGTIIVYFETEEEANATLDGVIARYSAPGAEIKDIGFSETVEVVKKEMALPTVFFSVHDGVNYIITGSTQPKAYVIQGGDTLWDIARANNISLSALQEMNPGLSPERLSIGQEIHLYETRPFLNVRFTEVVTSLERIAYQTQYEDTDALYRGQTQVKSAGSYGSKETVSQVVKENGAVISSVVLSETILQEPVTQFALRGTKATPVYTGAGSGTLSIPLPSVEVASAYGSRGGRRHTGVDLRAPKGTPIFAASEGVVTFSGYAGGLGNLVKISHGGGVETWYSHCDTMSVSIGDTVSKGQTIATVGSTGNARGYHLHFEVRVNGVPQNPMSYI